MERVKDGKCVCERESYLMCEPLSESVSQRESKCEPERLNEIMSSS